MFGKIGMGELLVILIIVLVVFGPSKLPSLAKSMGQAVREFRHEAQSLTKEMEESVVEETEAKNEKKDKEA